MARARATSTRLGLERFGLNGRSGVILRFRAFAIGSFVGLAPAWLGAQYACSSLI